MKLRRTIMSSAGYTRRVRSRYRGVAVLGVVLVAAALALSMWTMYYSSPRLSSKREFAVEVKGVEKLQVKTPGATGERVYYALKLESTSPVKVALLFMANSRRIGGVDFDERLVHEESGSLVLLEAPEMAEVVVMCEECSVSGSLVLRYSNVDYSLLLLLNIALITLSLTGIALFLYGAYSYVLVSYAESKKLGVPEETLSSSSKSR